jgi:diaminopimelate epimerase
MIVAMQDFLNGLPFAKGHGTGNDFVIVPDPDGELDLAADLVVALCDRRRGLGADGVLRVVRTVAHSEGIKRRGATGSAGETASSGEAPPGEDVSTEEPEWFMDYRNADGSLAEMCGNGARVFARYLIESGLAAGPRVPILTRAGQVVAEVADRSVAVDMPPPELDGRATARVSGVEHAGIVAMCGNPNLVCRVDNPAALDLTGTPEFDEAALPAGGNIEFFSTVGESADQAASDLHVRMRVVERGVGETLSCGSGACAVAAVALRDTGRDAGTVTIDVPGGRLLVTLADGGCVLAGPAVIVAAGKVRVPPAW